MPKHSVIHTSCPQVSVCIANYNGEAILTDCIESVLRQSEAINVEIIVHDDASTDASVDLIRKNYPRVKLIESKENVGFCIANNRMVDVAIGTYVLLLNNDAALFPDALAKLADAAERQTTRGILSLPQYDWETGELVDRGSLLDPFLNAVPHLLRDGTSVAYVIGSCLWIPRSLWQQLGGFPEWMGSIAEDLYLCLVARLAGIPVAALQDSGFRHWQGHSFGGNRIENGIRTTYRRRYLSERNRLCVLLCCTPGWWVAPWAVVDIAVIVLEGLALCIWMRSLRPWRDIYGAAVQDCWRNRRSIRESRRQVQSHRRIGLREYLREFRLIPRKLHLLLRHGAPRLHD